MRTGRHRRRGGFGGRSVRVVLLTLVVLGLVFSGTAYAGYRYDQSHADHVLPGVTIDGLAVGGMNREAAIAALEAHVQTRLTRALTVHAAGADLSVTPEALGSNADVAAAVDRALSLSDEFSWTHRVIVRLWHRPVNRAVSLDYRYDDAQIASWLKQVATDRYLAPRSASVDWVDDHLVLGHSKPGRALRSVQAADALLAAIKGDGAELTLPFKTIVPKVTEATLGDTIVVRTTVERLYLYHGLKLVKEYGVATGSPGYPTPHGRFKIVNKRMNPTWVNPAPNGWGAGEPAFIGPGPGNPLGTRALDLNAPGIRIHGTYADYSIGTPASHGCIRMHIPDSEALFDLVDVGTPVIIVY